MPARRTTNSSNGLSPIWLMLAVLLLLTVSGAGATLWATGFFAQAAESHEGQIAFPSLVRPVKAYERITREDLVDLETQQLRPIWLDKEMVRPGLLRDLSQIVGRVVARDKQPGFILTESDLLPVGTRPGVTAGVPPGKRSLSIAVDKVPGLELLRQGDTFDLLAALPARDEAFSNIEQAALLGGIKPPDTRSGQLARQTGIKPLVLGGTMVALTKGSTQSTVGSQSLVVDAQVAARRRNQTKIVATVAIDPEEVSPLTEALGLDVEMYCVARSGHAEDKSTDSKQVSFEGLVPVVTTAREVKAYSALWPEDLADAVTGRLNVYYFAPDRVEPGWVTDFRSLVGRVVAKNVPRGSVLNEEMLLPAGTRPGLVAGAPPGTVVLPVPASRLAGLHRLKNGDRFSVYNRLPNDLRPAFPLTDWATLQGAIRSSEDQRLEDQLRTGVAIVVNGAVLVGETDIEADPQDKSETIVGIAVPEESVVQLVQLLKGETELFVVANSGREPDAGQPVDPDQITIGPAGSALARADAETTLVSFQKEPRLADAQDQDGIAVPVTTRQIKAYSRLAVEDFIDPSTGRPRIMFFPADRVGKGWVRDLNDLIDRVVTRDIKPGRVIDKSMLLPVGSQSGSTAGIPAGMLGLTVNGQQVHGLDSLENLQRGDHFQLVTARPYDVSKLGGTVRRGLTGGDAIGQALSTGALFERAVVDVICEKVRLADFGSDVQVVRRNVEYEVESTKETLLTPGGPVNAETQTEKPQVTEREVASKSYLLAVAPEDLGPLAQAIAVGTTIYAVPLSGSSSPSVPQSASNSRPRELPVTGGDLPRPKIVEHIRGTEVTRDVWITPNNR